MLYEDSRSGGIIWDERVVAEDLALSIKQLIDEPLSIVQLHSVKEAITWLKAAPEPDLQRHSAGRWFEL